MLQDHSLKYKIFKVNLLTKNDVNGFNSLSAVKDVEKRFFFQLKGSLNNQVRATMREVTHYLILFSEFVNNVLGNTNSCENVMFFFTILFFLDVVLL